MFLYRNVHRFKVYQDVRYFCKTTLKNKALDENTVTGRLLLCVKDLNQRNASELNTSISFDWNKSEHVIKELQSSKTPSELSRKLNYFNNKCCNRLTDLDTTSIFNILNIYMKIVPNKILKYEFYKAALTFLNEYFQFLSTKEVLQLMFYAGLQKNTGNSELLLKQCLRSFNQKTIDELTVNELSIICNSTFKCSTRIKNEAFCVKIIDTINNNLDILKDTRIFVTLIKTLRHNRAQNESILSTISCAMLFNSTYEHYDFTTMCHVLALFSDYSYYDENILNLFKDKAVEELTCDVVKKSNFSDKIRAKDIKRFLWAYSNLGYKLDKRLIKDVFIKIMVKKIGDKDYDDEPETLLDCILYLWIMEYQAFELVPYCFSNDKITQIKKSKTKSKDKLNMLLSCMQLENLSLFKELQLKPQSFQYYNIKKQLSYRPNLERVYGILKELSDSVELNKFEYECQIPHVQIVGITGYKKNIYKSVFIEVFDDYVCVKNKIDYASGLMQLKLRLLDKMDQGLIIISTDDLNTMNDAELKEHLIYEINMVC
ncbi:PREDICTED: uncharacterized protein LOC108566167 [Nicrophorus vespilloides]|uniref:Uncharacterized protein LOC108566167 n=1 Tax=Nicrophorus vespilloides TaxID=110193 RepID=A0ABM1N3M5_NICVS|nr:PREDICTED: uncharacterized protein LOC108566167 [Nicrophorus vespilloides]